MTEKPPTLAEAMRAVAEAWTEVGRAFAEEAWSAAAVIRRFCRLARRIDADLEEDRQEDSEA